MGWWGVGVIGLLGRIEQINALVLNNLKSNLNMLSGSDKVDMGRERERATGSKQSAKRRQRAGGVKSERARGQNDIRQAGKFREVPRSPDNVE